MKIKEWIRQPNPLGSVKIEEIIEKNVPEEEMDLEQQVALRLAKQNIAHILGLVYRRGIQVQGIAKLNSLSVKEFVPYMLSLIAEIWSILFNGIQAREREFIQEIFSEEDTAERLNKLNTALFDLKKRTEMALALLRSQRAEHMEREGAKKSLWKWIQYSSWETEERKDLRCPRMSDMKT
jgi:hypothetical protein